mmetsp:Transcript_8758/g.14389  ORF Transcript_8758/g.14389 Transcript_8758/m.14389 type:complete len:362 (+) Transcript_8758:154-1239(+)
MTIGSVDSTLSPSLPKPAVTLVSPVSPGPDHLSKGHSSELSPSPSPNLHHSHTKATASQGPGAPVVTNVPVESKDYSGQSNSSVTIIQTVHHISDMHAFGESAVPPRYAFSFHELIRIFANRIYYSTAYQVLYLGMIIVNIFIMGWTLVNWDRYPDHVWFFVLELVINFIFVMEVVVRMIALRVVFWRQWSNVFDVFVLAISIVMVGFYYQRELPFEVEDVAATLLLVLRYIIQFLRLFIFIKNHRRNRSVTSDEQRIDFSNLPAPEHDLEAWDDLGVVHVPRDGMGGTSALLSPTAYRSDNISNDGADERNGLSLKSSSPDRLSFHSRLGRTPSSLDLRGDTRYSTDVRERTSSVSSAVS